MEENKSDIEKILAERAKLDEVLRTQFTKKITVMFTDIKGSTAFYEQHGDVDGRLLVHRHNEQVMPVIEENHGVLIKTIGDATMSVFDDPADAVRAARQIQLRLQAYNGCRPEDEQIKVRIGLNTGMGIVDEKDVFGDVVNTASRVETLADGGEVVVTEDLYREVKDNKEFVFRFADVAKVKGKQQALKAYRLIWCDEELLRERKGDSLPTAKTKKFSLGRTRAASGSTRAGASRRFPSGMKLLFSLVLALGLVVLIVDLVSEGVAPDGAAVATQVQGTVRVFNRESPSGRQIMSNESIAKNDRVETEANSRIELRLPDGGALRLSENSRLLVRMLKFEKRTGTMNLQAFLDNGDLWARIKKRATSDEFCESCVEVITKDALVSANGSVYRMHAEKEAGTTINVYEGAVLALNAAKGAAQPVGQASAPAEARPVSVQALQQVSVPAKEDPAQPQTFDPKATINDWVRWNLQRDAREELVSITVAPASPTVTRGRSLQFAGVAHYPDKSEKDITWFATWGSSDAGIAKIDPFGNVGGAAIGAATITAAIEDMNGSTMLNVSRDVVSIKVTPASGSIVNGAAQQFTATGTFSDKTVGDITSSAVWSSSNPNVALVDAAGRAVAGAKAGTAVISASLGGKRGSATLKVRRELVSITIMPATAITMSGETQRFGAIGNYSDGTTQDLTEKAYWETSDPDVALVEEVQPGRVIGHDKQGSATITATYNGKSGTATVTVEKMQSP